MIDLYYWPTPNGHKITMFLEETDMPYKLVPVNIGAGEQFKAEFLRISPNNRMPAIVDHTPLERGAPISVFESGAILLYLADKSEQFIANDLRGRVEVLQWLFWQVGGLGPMAGQNHHFNAYSLEKIPYAIDRYVKETNRLNGVLNKRVWPIANSSLARIPSPIWRAIPGLSSTSARGSALRTSSISSAGSKRSEPSPPSGAPTHLQRPSTRSPP